MKNKHSEILSLQREINLEKIYSIRNKMISEHKLHIQDSISYDQFKVLFNKYGNWLNEVDFARYFLDVDYRSFYNLKSGLRETTSILERQYYEYSDLDEIEMNFLQNTNFKPNDRIDYEELLNLHKEFGSFFPLKLFAEEILGLSAHAVDDMQIKRNEKRPILKKDKIINREEIFRVRNKVAVESGYHIKSQITLAEFNELYKKYALPEMSERLFALKILGISTDTSGRFLSGKRPKVLIFPTFPINPKYICELREKVILEENLHINDVISNERFVELYEKYGGILTEELFAEEILDVSLESIRQSKRRNHNVYILGNINIDGWIDAFRNKIVEENHLTPYELMSLARIRELYKKYPSILLEKMFAVNVLLIPDYNYFQLTTGATFESKILIDTSEKDFKIIRKKVIQENNLHYDDKMEYYELHRLHKLYAPTVQEYIFANKILDIPQGQLDNIRHDKGNKYTHILLLEPLPSKEELSILKRKVIYNEKLHRRDSIDYKTFRRLYETYAGIMPEDMFAEQILDINNVCLRRIRAIPKDQYETSEISRTQILLKTHMTQKEINELKEQVFFENSLYPGKEISLRDAVTIYQNYQHILYPKEFYKKVLHINGAPIGNFDYKDISIFDKKFTIGEIDKKSWKSNKPFSNSEIKQIKQCLINGYTREQIAGYIYRPLDKTNELIKELVDREVISIEECKIENIKKLYFVEKLSISEIEKKTGTVRELIQKIIDKLKEDEKSLKKALREQKYLENRCSKMLKKSEYTPKGILLVKEYIKKSLELYTPKNFPYETLDFLGECIFFVEGDGNAIKFFAQSCIAHMEYDKADKFISQNIGNEGVEKKDRIALRKLQSELKYAKLQERAINMFLTEDLTPEEVSKRTGILLTDAIRIKRSIQNKNLKKVVKNDTEYRI